MKKTRITHINNNHSDWLRALDFYKQEIAVLKSRLTEIASKNTGQNVLAQVEHFENQFKVQDDNIGRLRHDINANVLNIAEQVKDSTAAYIDHDLADKHDQLEEAFTSEEKIINKLRGEFNGFASTWL